MIGRPGSEERDTTPPRRTRGPALGRGIVALPTRLVASLFWVALVVCACVVLGVLAPSVVLPAAAAVLALTWRLVPRPVPATGPAVLGALAALAIAGSFVAWNLPHVGQLLLVQRDPGFLTLQALWLVDHPDPHIPLGSAVDVAAAVPSVSLVSDAFWQDGALAYAQGAKTVPGLLAMAGWVAGRDGVLAANLLIGAIALLALYDLARRLTDALWGLVPVLALATTMPMAAFTRSPFTEPTTMALVLGGLVVLWDAHRDPRAHRYAVGAAMVGGGALSRIDGAAAIAGMILGLGLVVAWSRSLELRRARARGLLAATVSGLSMVGLGYADLRVNSPGYLAEHQDQYRALLALVAACALVALAWPRLVRARVDRVARSRPLGTAAAVAVLLLGAALASRPLWLEAHGFDPGSPYAAFIAANQQSAGLEVDGTRSYDELTLTWLSWYQGRLALVLALVALALLVRRAIADRRPELVVLIATLGVPALLYLVRPSITPDQVWAMRRLLPVVMPAVLLCGAWLLHRMWHAPPRGEGARGMGGSGPLLARAAAGALAILVVAFPPGTWGTLFPAAEYGGRQAEVDALCSAVAGSPLVAVRPTGPPLLATARIACGVDAVELAQAEGAEPGELAAIRQAWGGGRVVVASYVADSVPWAAGNVPGPTVSTPMVRWPHLIGARPQEPVAFTSDLWLGEVQPDGTVRPL